MSGGKDDDALNAHRMKSDEIHTHVTKFARKRRNFCEKDIPFRHCGMFKFHV